MKKFTPDTHTSQEWLKGYEACVLGESCAVNPYNSITEYTKHEDFNHGWLTAHSSEKIWKEYA